MQCTQDGIKKNISKSFKQEPILYLVYSDSILIQWDKPSDTSIDISQYKLLCRVHGNSTWVTLNKTIPAIDAPFTVIKKNEIPFNDSLLDFAVRAYNKYNDSSDINVSSDSLSTPKGGWFVKWLSIK